MERGQKAGEAGDCDHTGEVRNQLHPETLQSGGRAGADLHGWHGAGESRRHGNGPGAAHQDARDRDEGAGGGEGASAADAHPHRQGAEHVRNGGKLGWGSQRCGGQGRLQAAPA